MIINEAKLRGYILLIKSGRRQLAEVPDPYQAEVEKAIS